MIPNRGRKIVQRQLIDRKWSGPSGNNGQVSGSPSREEPGVQATSMSGGGGWGQRMGAEMDFM